MHTRGLRELALEDVDLEVMRLLVDRRDELSHLRVQIVNRLHRLRNSSATATASALTSTLAGNCGGSPGALAAAPTTAARPLLQDGEHSRVPLGLEQATCKCADGESLHEATVLSYSQDGRNRTLMLAPDQIEAVTAAVTRYRQAQAKLEREANAGLAELVTRAAAHRGR